MNHVQIQGSTMAKPCRRDGLGVRSVEFILRAKGSPAQKSAFDVLNTKKTKLVKEKQSKCSSQGKIEHKQLTWADLPFIKDT